MSTTNTNGSVRQALSDEHKDAVRNWVPKIRHVLEDEFAAQLDRLGLKSDGKHRPLEKMRLPDDAISTRRRVEALLRRDSVAEGSAMRGFENVKREFAYTLLNRLVGLKAMEARELLYLPPPNEPDATAEQTEVLTPIPGQNYSRYVRDYRAAGGNLYKYAEGAEESLVRDALTSAFRYVSREIRILFDPYHEYSCLWPSHGSLITAIQMVNDGLPFEAYQAPDFLGWVYQFFNREEKKRVREENKGIPRSSYELAVINQFYTPSWVVKALVDNTLGRLWLQMHPDSSIALMQDRNISQPIGDYLVPRTGEKLRYQQLTDTGEVVGFKRARDITLLDPACGTMHFGQYAFQLFQQMYLDEIDNSGKTGWPDKPSLDQPHEIPAAILENNLFGIDIDPRAIQIASLSLMLTAKEAAVRFGLSPVDVNIRRANLVVANAVNIGEQSIRTLVEKVMSGQGTKNAKVKELEERLFTELWENLKNVGELGSLVQVREGVSRVLFDWVEARAREKGLTKLAHRSAVQPTFEFVSEFDRERARQLDLERQLLEAEAGHLEAELLTALEEAAAEATNDPAERLFAEDTARGLKLLQILSRSYDVVVMNPPYGAFVPRVRSFVKVAYPLTHNDIYATFIDRATQLADRVGFIGALVSGTFVNLASFESLRKEILLKRNPLIVMLDLGKDILDDANVRAAAIVLRGSGQ